MKNRKVVILSVLVVAVWGLIGYRIFDGLSSEEQSYSPRIVKTTSRLDAPAKQYTLSLEYQDPFLKKSFVEKKAPSKTRQGIVRRERTETAPVMVQIRWERLVYLAAVHNTTRTSLVATIALDEVEHFVKAGETLDDLTFVAIERDSMLVSSLGQSHYIKREK